MLPPARSDFGYYRPENQSVCVEQPELKGHDLEFCLYGRRELLRTSGYGPSPGPFPNPDPRAAARRRGGPRGSSCVAPPRYRKIPGDKCAGGESPSREETDMKKKCTSTLLSPSQLVGDTDVAAPTHGCHRPGAPHPAPSLPPAGGVPQLRAHCPGRGGRAAHHRSHRGAAHQEIRLWGQVSPPPARGAPSGTGSPPTGGDGEVPFVLWGTSCCCCPPPRCLRGVFPSLGGATRCPQPPRAVPPPRFLVHRYSVLRQHAEASGAEGTEGTDPSSPPRKGGYHDDSDEVSAPPLPPKTPLPLGCPWLTLPFSPRTCWSSGGDGDGAELPPPGGQGLGGFAAGGHTGGLS